MKLKKTKLKILKNDINKNKRKIRLKDLLIWLGRIKADVEYGLLDKKMFMISFKHNDQKYQVWNLKKDNLKKQNNPFLKDLYKEFQLYLEKELGKAPKPP